MSSKKVKEKSQATMKMVRITIEVEKRLLKNLKVACVSGTWLTVSTIVKNKDVIKLANVAQGVKLLTKQRFLLLLPSQHHPGKHSTLLSKVKEA